MSVQASCAIACILIGAYVTVPQTLAAMSLSEHTKILHTLAGMSSAALAAAVSLSR